MTNFLFDKLTDTADFNVTNYDAAYAASLGDNQDRLSVSANGVYTAGGTAQNTLWVVKITPHGSPTKVHETVYDGVYWTGSDSAAYDMQPYAVDGEGDIWGTYGGVNLDVDPTITSRGPVAYIDADNPSVINSAFSWTEGTTAEEHRVTAIYPFTLPDDSILVIVIPGGERFFSHVKGTNTYTAHDTSSPEWKPNFVFQDSNGDVWVTGTPPSTGTVTQIVFKRVTSISSAYTASQTITVPGAVNPAPGFGNFPGGAGYFASDCFISAWEGSSNPPGYSSVLKINLATQAVTSADFSADPLLFPPHISPADPTYYFVMKHSDVSDAGFRTFYALQTDLTLGQSYDLDSWSAGDTGNDPNSINTYDDVYTRYWCDGTQCFVGNRFQWMSEDGTFDETATRMVADLFIYYFGTPRPDGAGDGTTDASPTIRCWGAQLDGHHFYFVRLGASATLVYDRLTRQWSEWQSPGRTNWRAHCGQNWAGCATFANGQSDVVGGDDATGVLWRLNPTVGRDDRSDGSGDSDKFTRKATGMIAVNGRNTIPCNALQLTLALGAPTQTAASLILKTSDNLGKSWLTHGAVETVTGVYNQTVEWRGLGTARAPGRLFSIEDDGATVRIGRAQIR